MWCEIDNIEFYYLYYTLGHFTIFKVIGKYLVFVKLAKQYKTDKITYYPVDIGKIYLVRT